MYNSYRWPALLGISCLLIVRKEYYGSGFPVWNMQHLGSVSFFSNLGKGDWYTVLEALDFSRISIS